jgi:hypothetical protein
MLPRSRYSKSRAETASQTPSPVANSPTITKTSAAGTTLLTLGRLRDDMCCTPQSVKDLD